MSILRYTHNNKPLPGVCLLVCVRICMSGLHLPMYSIWVSHEEKSTKSVYQCAMIIYISIFPSSKLTKGHFCMYPMQETDFFFILKAFFKEAYFLAISSQKANLKKQVCIILCIFYWQCSLDAESQLAFLDLHTFQATIFCIRYTVLNLITSILFQF